MSAFSQLIWTDIGFKLLSVLLLIAINAFFVTAEFSMVTVRRTRIHQLVQAGDIPAIAVEMLQRSIDRLLSTAQLGITLSSLALGWIGESSIVVIVNAWLQSWPLPGNLSNFLAHSLSIPITFFLLAYLQIVLGELFPKSVAMLYSEQLARFLGPSVKAIVRFFSPVIWILNQSTRYLLKLFRIEYTGQSWRPPVTPEELQLIISTERESTGLELAERELLNNVFEFGEITAQDVMIPRTSIITLPEDATFQTLLQEMTSTGHSLYPIIGES
ncbi:MAG: hemolysin family protein, partial [Sphaerospermopsis kisseleviana]